MDLNDQKNTDKTAWVFIIACAIWLGYGLGFIIAKIEIILNRL